MVAANARARAFFSRPYGPSNGRSARRAALALFVRQLLRFCVQHLEIFRMPFSLTSQDVVRHVVIRATQELPCCYMESHITKDGERPQRVKPEVESLFLRFSIQSLSESFFANVYNEFLMLLSLSFGAPPYGKRSINIVNMRATHTTLVFRFNLFSLSTFFEEG